MAVLLIRAPLFAQENPPTVPVMGEVFVNSELERYLRVLQTAGVVKPYPWSIRGFSMEEVERLAPGDSAHPWVGRYAIGGERKSGFQWRLLRPESQVIYNSAFPYGYNDGAIWAGRGVTSAVQAGLAARYGPVSLVLAPQVFWAQNAEFELMANGRSGAQRFADGRFPENIDLPQRFGVEPYLQVSPGQSTLRLDEFGVTLGLSTANQHWGPAAEYPFLLGNNAAGFPHAFVGSAAPRDLWIGRAHGRVVWGILDQSAYVVTEGAAERRFMAGALAVFVPRGVPGLEVGAARFIHSVWPEQGPGVNEFLSPFGGIFKGGLRSTGSDDGSDDDNQLAALFTRWVFPGSGLELFGEFGREDHSWDLRDVVLEPDHQSTYSAGLQKVWTRPDSTLVALRLEAFNAQAGHLAGVRQQGPVYLHFATLQGHTQRGQLLGSYAGYGGAGATTALDVFHPRGRWTLGWTRALRQDRSRYASDEENSRTGVDVLHSVAAETLFFYKNLDISAATRGVYNLDRNFDRDVFNWNGTLSVRFAF